MCTDVKAIVCHGSLLALLQTKKIKATLVLFVSVSTTTARTIVGTDFPQGQINVAISLH